MIVTRKFLCRQFLSVLHVHLVPVVRLSGPTSYCFALCSLPWQEGRVMFKIMIKTENLKIKEDSILKEF